MKKNGHKRNSQDYLHSLDFVEAIKKAREYQPDKDALVIFAGACQSYYELLVASGANFASSPSRKNIHALDPVIITTQIASTNIKEYVDLEKVIEKTSFCFEVHILRKIGNNKADPDFWVQLLGIGCCR